MNKQEFIEALGIFGITEVHEQIEAPYGDIEDAYLWNNLLIYFSGVSSVYVKGRIPLVVAQDIYKKYSYPHYGFRPERDSDVVDPVVYAVDDIYRTNIDEAKKDIKSATGFYEYLQSEIRNLRQRGPKDKYLTKYVVNTKDGFIILLKELDGYFKEQTKEKSKIKTLNKNMG